MGVVSILFLKNAKIWGFEFVKDLDLIFKMELVK
jgi:hypothetical protein